MTRPNRGLALLAGLLAAGATAAPAEPGRTASPRHPNVVFILADDLGWGDVACHGGSIPTPQLDHLFHEGLELGTFLVTPLCSPTRASLLTGRHPARTGIGPFVINPDTAAHLRAEETTLAEAFRSGGYATACFGKWHLGYSPTANEQGFDVFQGCAGAAVDYFDRTRQRDGKLDWLLNGKPLEVKGYTTDIIRDAAVAYLGEDRQRPFFLYVPFTAVHNPQQAPKEYLDRVPAAITNKDKRVYAAMVIALDDAIGAILKTLEDRHLAENTIVLFASDNGGTPTGNNKPFHGGKHTVYDGGLRSPTVIRWPGRIPGGRRTDSMMAAEDVYPTLLSLAQVTPPAGLPLDGFDCSDVMLKDAASPRHAQFWIWHDSDAVRTERWKLIRRWNTRELYDLKADPQETKNLAAEERGVVADLEAKLNAFETSAPCYPSHVPVRLDSPARPGPEGDVLKVQVKWPGSGGNRKLLAITLGRAGAVLSPGDRLEYDMMVPAGSAAEGFFVDMPGRPDEPAAFEGTDAVDQYGLLQQSAKGFPQANGHWARRVIGLANRAPRPMGIVRLAFVGKAEADYLLYLDNIVIRRADGETIEVYRNGPARQARVLGAKGDAQVAIKVVPAADTRSAASQP